MFVCFQISENAQISDFHYKFKTKKCYSFDQGLCPCTTLGAPLPDPRYMLALRALAMLPPLPNPKYATASRVLLRLSLRVSFVI